MHKTFVLLTLSTLLPACLEPNAMIMGDDDESSGAAYPSDPTEEAPSGETEPGPRDDGDDTDGDDDPEDDGESDESDESGESGESGAVEPEPTCDLSTHRCISNVPEGWNGPVARIDGDDPVGCHGAFDMPAVQTYDELFAAAAVCTCDCGAPNGGECEDALSFEVYPIGTVFGTPINSMGCDMMYDGEPQTVQAGQTWSYPSAANEDNARIIADPLSVIEPGQCNPLHTETIAEPQLGGVVQACEPSAAPTSCDDETMCVPKAAAPFEAGVCIWTEGDVACPAGTDFFEREVRSSGVVDTRTCSECSCGNATGQACDDSTVSLWRAGALPVELPIDGTCNTAYLGASSYWTAISYDANEPTGGGCDPEGGMSSGSAEPEQQITFCCS